MQTLAPTTEWVIAKTNWNKKQNSTRMINLRHHLQTTIVWLKFENCTRKSLWWKFKRRYKPFHELDKQLKQNISRWILQTELIFGKGRYCLSPFCSHALELLCLQVNPQLNLHEDWNMRKTSLVPVKHQAAKLLKLYG